MNRDKSIKKIEPKVNTKKMSPKKTQPESYQAFIKAKGKPNSNKPSPQKPKFTPGEFENC